MEFTRPGALTDIPAGTRLAPNPETTKLIRDALRYLFPCRATPPTPPQAGKRRS